MLSRLISIVGIDKKVEQILRQKANIGTIKQLYDATRTSTERTALAEKTNFSLASITLWAVQAELLRVGAMSIDTAYDLIEAGIYSVDQLKAMGTKEIFEKVKSKNVYSNISEAMITQLKNSPVRDAKQFEYEAIRKELVEVENTAPSIYTDLSRIISELGRGIAQAQLALDESSIAIQNRILSEDKLYQMGLQATWYVMPEVEFTLKMDYAVTEERTSSGTVLSSKVCAAPSNATFNNFFKSEKREESSVRLKFVPIPASDKMSERKYMPDLSKVNTIQGIVTAMEDNGIYEYKIVPEEMKDLENVSIKVESQMPKANTLMLIGADTPVITVKKKSK